MTTQPTYILVHGAWHAAWCWEKMIPLMNTSGYDVIAPNLPGHGSERIRPSQVTLASYTQCLIDLIQKQTTPVKLLGHSMAGIIISQVAEIIPERVNELIYICAYIPKDGDSLFTIAERSKSRGLSPYLQVDRMQGEIRLQSSPAVAELLYSMCSEEDKAQAVARIQSQPLQPFAASAQLGENFKKVSKKVIICSKDRALLPEDQLSMAQEIIDQPIMLEADHSPFYSNPVRLMHAMIK